MDDSVRFKQTCQNPAESGSAQAWLLVDAGVGHVRLRLLTVDGVTLSDRLVPSNTDLRQVFAPYGLGEAAAGTPPDLLITGKLAETVRDILGLGQVVLPSAAFWLT